MTEDRVRKERETASWFLLQSGDGGARDETGVGEGGTVSQEQ